MRIELIKYFNDTAELRWKIVNDGNYINLYATEEEALKGFEKYIARLQEPKPEPTIIKSVEI